MITGMHLKNHNLFKSFYVVLRTKNEEGRMVIKLKIIKLIKPNLHQKAAHEFGFRYSMKMGGAETDHEHVFL